MEGREKEASPEHWEVSCTQVPDKVSANVGKNTTSQRTVVIRGSHDNHVHSNKTSSSLQNVGSPRTGKPVALP